MQIVEITAGTLRFADAVPATAPADGFVWIYLDRAEFAAHPDIVQQAAQRLGGSALLDVHVVDLVSELHPSDYDATSIYDIVIFRRLATAEEAPPRVSADLAADPSADALAVFARIESRQIGFAIFDKLLISVHPPGCHSAPGFIQRFLTDAQLSADQMLNPRNLAPQSPADLTLRMINSMVEGYLNLRKDLASALESVQHELLRSQPQPSAWRAVIHARRRLHLLEDLCEEQHDAIQEWLDTLSELPLSAYAADPAQAQHRRDQLVARTRDVIEHIDRVLRHARRLEQSAEAAVQIHFGAQGQRTNDIMRVLTAITAIFLPLNLFTGFFGMNFDSLPLIHSAIGMWAALVLLALLAAAVLVWFWRRRYITEMQD